MAVVAVVAGVLYPCLGVWEGRPVVGVMVVVLLLVVVAVRALYP